MSTPSRQSLVMENAAPNDARLLVDNRRFASAFALAVLAMEEIGKALIDGWNSDIPLAKPKGFQSLHIQKQSAVAALLVGMLAVRMFPEGSVVDLEGDRLAKL